MHNLYRFQADGDDLSDEAQDVIRVVGAVGIVAEAAPFVRFDLILVNDPLQGGAVA